MLSYKVKHNGTVYYTRHGSLGSADLDDVASSEYKNATSYANIVTSDKGVLMTAWNSAIAPSRLQELPTIEDAETEVVDGYLHIKGTEGFAPIEVTRDKIVRNGKVIWEAEEVTADAEAEKEITEQTEPNEESESSDGSEQEAEEETQTEESAGEEVLQAGQVVIEETINDGETENEQHADGEESADEGSAGLHKEGSDQNRGQEDADGESNNDSSVAEDHEQEILQEQGLVVDATAESGNDYTVQEAYDGYKEAQSELYSNESAVSPKEVDQMLEMIQAGEKDFVPGEVDEDAEARQLVESIETPKVNAFADELRDTGRVMAELANKRFSVGMVPGKNGENISKPSKPFTVGMSHSENTNAARTGLTLGPYVTAKHDAGVAEEVMTQVETAPVEERPVTPERPRFTNRVKDGSQADKVEEPKVDGAVMDETNTDLSGSDDVDTTVTEEATTGTQESASSGDTPTDSTWEQDTSCQETTEEVVTESTEIDADKIAASNQEWREALESAEVLESEKDTVAMGSEDVTDGSNNNATYTFEPAETDFPEFLSDIPKVLLGAITSFFVREIPNENINSAYVLENNWEKAGQWYATDIVGPAERIFYNATTGNIYRTSYLTCKAYLKSVGE